MKEIKTKEKYHNEILEIWKKVGKISKLKKLYKRDAFLQDTLYKNSILFLGISASTRKGYADTCEKVNHVQYETEIGRIKYPYYKPMRDLSSETGFGSNWSNIDITLFRAKDQKELELFFNSSSDIMQDQLDLATRMIIDVKPEIIIVSNAFVGKVLHNNEDVQLRVKSGFCLDYDEKVIDKYGTPLISSPKALKGIPVFFTSMLSGQRALDIGSRNRLIWHIKYVQNKKTNPKN